MSTAFALSEQALADKAAALPALPSVVTELLDSFNNPDLDVDTLARTITNDQALAARALRIANSPFYGLAGRVTTVHDAIVVLGFRAVRSLVLSAAMVDSVGKVGEGQQNLISFWRHSVAVALLARGLAKQVGENPETAFTAGLLHDIGRVFFGACFPEHYRQVKLWQHTHDAPSCHAEQEVLGLTHGTAGRVLAKKWGLPAAIIAAISHHHEPEAEQPQRLVDICHGADVLSRALDCHADLVVPPVSSPAWERLKPDWSAMGSLLATAESELEDTCLALLP